MSRITRCLVALAAVIGLFAVATPAQASWDYGVHTDPITVTEVESDSTADEVLPDPDSPQGAEPAAAGYFLGFRHDSTTICLEDRIGNPNFSWVGGAVGWNSSDANFYVRTGTNSCTTPASQEVILRYYRASDGNCAFTQTYYSAARVTAQNIWMNTYNPNCWSSAARRAHVISHELGHALGLAHQARAASVMTQSWAEPLPTQPDAFDESLVNSLYPGGL
jgi:hypothetical protein